MIKYLFLALTLHLSIFAYAKAPYVVFNVSQGVILHSSTKGDIVNPRSGEEVFKEDYFIIQDSRYIVKIKDANSGEIYSISGKYDKIYPEQVVNFQKYILFDKFNSLLVSILTDIGFDTAPVKTSQCVINKGGERKMNDSISIIIGSHLRRLIADNININGVKVQKVYSINGDVFNYSIQNNDTVDYDFVIYTVDRNNGIYLHNEIIVAENGRYQNDKIAFIPLLRKTSFDLTYFTMAAMNRDNSRTCYVLLFRPMDFYKKRVSGKYECVLDWKIIEKELQYQGDVHRIIYLGSRKIYK